MDVAGAVGEGAVVAAGAVVTKDITSYNTVERAQAHIIKKRELSTQEKEEMER